MKIKERIAELTKILSDANISYYTLDAPTMTDYEYDLLYKELVELESKYPEYVLADSPTNKIGDSTLSKFSKVTHLNKMYSLSNVYSPDELKSFIEKLQKDYPNIEFNGELKIDGLAINLDYENGFLVRAATRGNGTIGEDVTLNVKTIKSIPHKLTEDLTISIRGEIFMTYESFLKVNKYQEENDLPLFANPRNAAAGSLRQLDSKIVATRNLDAIFYQIVNPLNYQITKQSDVLAYLDKLGLPISKENKIVKIDTDLSSLISDFDAKREDLSFPTDGIVFKCNSLSLYEEIGFTSKYPKWAIAYKFAPEKATTIVKDIIFQVGRTGVLTPVAILEPVQLDGSVIARATLHNYNFILEKDIRISDHVIIHKAAEIIPEVVEVILSKRTNNTSFPIIDKCPVCGSVALYTNPELFCSNPNCSERVKRQLEHFASRNALNIDGLGYEIVNNLYNDGYIKSIPDIYTLKDKYDELKETPYLGNFGKKKEFKRLDNLITSIENSKIIPFENILFGLGIDFVGLSIAKILTKKFPNIDDFIKASVDDILSIRAIGPQIANSIVDYFSKEENLKKVELLKLSGLKLEVNKINQEKPLLEGLNFVITGSFVEYSRTELTNIVEKYQGHVTSSVTSKTNYVIVGEDAGSKLDKANQLKITTLNLEAFLKLIEEKDIEF